MDNGNHIYINKGVNRRLDKVCLLHHVWNYEKEELILNIVYLPVTYHGIQWPPVNLKLHWMWLRKICEHICYLWQCLYKSDSGKSSHALSTCLPSSCLLDNNRKRCKLEEFCKYSNFRTAVRERSEFDSCKDNSVTFPTEGS